VTSARNTPCDSARNTPVSGDEESDHQRSDEGEHLFQNHNQNNQPNGTEFQHQSLHSHNHFRSFSHDGHLNHYTVGPISHGMTHYGGIGRATPPNEVEEDHHPQVVGTDGPSPSDSDGSHSFHDEASYAHQSTNYMSVGGAPLGVTPNGDMMKNGMAMMQSDPLRKDYSQIMDPSLMNQSWSFQ
jgi:hypothetical protein